MTCLTFSITFVFGHWFDYYIGCGKRTRTISTTHVYKLLLSKVVWLEVKPPTAELMLMLNVSTVIFHGEEACLLTNLTRT